MKATTNPLIDRKRTAYEQVQEFHEAFGHPVATRPSVIDPNRVRLRLALILEEVAEVVAEYSAESIGMHEVWTLTVAAITRLRTVEDEGLDQVDLANLAKELADLEYVVCGAALEHGIDLDRAMAAVHRSNMTKLGADGGPVYNEHGKVVKGPNYLPPDMRAVLNAQMEDAA